MIIGISGKINSGKDTVGKIIQYLTDTTFRHNSFKDYLKAIELEEPPHSKWEIKKYADTLKDMVCMLIGCTREQLEDSEFKETELGEEWNQYGYADGHTRDKNNRPIMTVKFCSKERYEEELRVNWQTAYKYTMTPRLLLQKLGTNCGRDIIHPNIWINSLFADYNKDIYYMCDKCMDTDIELIKIPNRFKEQGYTQDEFVCANCKGEESEGDLTKVISSNPSNWIITDVRFPNEVEAITKRNGINIRIEREDITGQGKLNPHTSETALDDYPAWDYVIHNFGDINDLVLQVRDILIKLKII